jgi:uncharacterized membrane protein
MEVFLWIVSCLALIVAIVAVYLIVAFMAIMREKDEEMKHLANRVDNLMELVREFNARLRDAGVR